MILHGTHAGMLLQTKIDHIADVDSLRRLRHGAYKHWAGTLGQFFGPL